MIVAEGSPEVLRSGMQAGARDVIAEPIGLEQLEIERARRGGLDAGAPPARGARRRR